MPFKFRIFGEEGEVPLDKSPLREVICQVKFPPILALAEDAPIKLQEDLRHDFPEYSVEPAGLVDGDRIKQGQSLGLKPPVHRFQTRDRRFTASLSVSFFAVSTRQYTHWPEFLRLTSCVAGAAGRRYQIPYATRIGLRFVNFIDTSYAEEGCVGSLLGLFRPALTTIFHEDEVTFPVFGMTELRSAQGDGVLVLRYGLAHTAQEMDNYGFVLDFDHYVEGQVDLGDLEKRCENYHRVIYSAFRWCVPEKHLRVFEPQPREQQE